MTAAGKKPRSRGGDLRKMGVQLDGGRAVYHLRFEGEEPVPLDGLLGHRLCLRHTGVIRCIHCGRTTSRSFSQGYCFPCFKRLARCDLCIVQPSRCHYAEGTCREPEWADTHCMSEHWVYLANTSSLKVGLTRRGHVPVRWLDQGAVQALPILTAATRQVAGFLEQACVQQGMRDSTNWRSMLRGGIAQLDLRVERERLLAAVAQKMEDIRIRFGAEAFAPLPEAEPITIDYPFVQPPPAKPRSLSLDKQPQLEGVLHGAKGQYLVFDGGVLNLRKFAGYHVELDAA